MSKLNVTTSTTRPASPNTGSIFFETDTNKNIFWDGTVWHLFDRDSVTAAAPSLVGGYLDIEGQDYHTLGNYMGGSDYTDIKYKQTAGLSLTVIASLAMMNGTNSSDPAYNKIAHTFQDASSSNSGSEENALTWYHDNNSTLQDFIDATSAVVDESDFTTPVAGTWIEVELLNQYGNAGDIYFSSMTSGLQYGTRMNFPLATEA